MPYNRDRTHLVVIREYHMAFQQNVQIKISAL